MMEALGAEVVLVAQAPGANKGEVSGEDLALVEAEARRITHARGAFRADQFQNRANVLAHERYTGPEIWQQTAGKVDAFVDFVGTAGSFTGIARALRTRNPQVRCYVAEPAGAPALAGHCVLNPRHPIQGGGYAMPELPLLDRSLVSGFLQVEAALARDAACLLAREEGVFGGFSTGANLAAALQLISSQEKGSSVVLIACDSGLKYLSTSLYGA